MLGSFCPIDPQMLYYSPILPSVFVNQAPRALIAKIKSHQSQGQEATLLKVLHSYLFLFSFFKKEI